MSGPLGSPLEMMDARSNGSRFCPKVVSYTLFALVWMCGSPEDSWKLIDGNFEFETLCIMEIQDEIRGMFKYSNYRGIISSLDITTTNGIFSDETICDATKSVAKKRLFAT